MSKNIYARFDKNQDGQVSEDDFLSVMGLLLHGAVKSKQYCESNHSLKDAVSLFVVSSFVFPVGLG